VAYLRPLIWRRLPSLRPALRAPPQAVSPPLRYSVQTLSVPRILTGKVRAMPVVGRPRPGPRPPPPNLRKLDRSAVSRFGDQRAFRSRRKKEAKAAEWCQLKQRARAKERARALAEREGPALSSQQWPSLKLLQLLATPTLPDGGGISLLNFMRMRRTRLN
jgi:hypothetical protein